MPWSHHFFIQAKHHQIPCNCGSAPPHPTLLLFLKFHHRELYCTCGLLSKRSWGQEGSHSSISWFICMRGDLGGGRVGLMSPSSEQEEGLRPPELKLILVEAEERLDGNLWPTWGDKEEPGRELWLQCCPYAPRCHL